MRDWFKVPVLFLFLGAAIGTLMRYHFVMPMKFFSFMHWLHAHSHMMFLGWITNLLVLAFLYEWIEAEWKRFRALFIAIQLVILGLTTAFILQGYGLLSITCLALHSIVMFIFCVMFYRRTRHVESESISFARSALFFFVLSTLGAFALGPISANNLGHTKWYYFAIFFYLHFQYNGFFTFGILALVFRSFERNNIPMPEKRVRLIRLLLLYSCMAAYLLSVIWSDPGVVIQVIAGMAAVAQMIAFFLFISLRNDAATTFFKSQGAGVRILLISAGLAWMMKLVLQLASVVPAVAHLATDVRFLVLSYLHLVLIGMVTFSLLAWLSTSRIIPPIKLPVVVVLLIGFVVTEAFMALTPLFGGFFSTFMHILFAGALMMLTGFAAPLLSIFRRSAP